MPISRGLRVPLMSNPPFDEVDSDSASIAVVDAPEAPIAPDDSWTGPRCEKCSEPIRSESVTICRQCGWYPSLGKFLEVDPDFEFQNDAAAPAQPAPSHLQVWLGLVPWWGWVLFGSVTSVLVVSIVVRLATPSGIGGIRTTWSLTQLLLGVLFALGCHFLNFMVLASEDSDLGLLDILLRPIKLWIRAFQRLPTRLWIADGAAVGVAAVLSAIFVIGALPYDRLWDWGFTPPPKQDLMAAVMDRAKQVNGREADNLEDAIGDFAGTADSLTDPLASATQDEPKRQTADCVILGYRMKGSGLPELILGRSHLGKLVYAGSVTPTRMSGADRRGMLETLQSLQTDQPFIPMTSSAIWVTPRLACRVTYGEIKPSGRLTDLQWDTLTGEVSRRAVHLRVRPCSLKLEPRIRARSIVGRRGVPARQRFAPRPTIAGGSRRAVCLAHGARPGSYREPVCANRRAPIQVRPASRADSLQVFSASDRDDA